MTDYRKLIADLERLSTEGINPNTVDIDQLSAEEIVTKINAEDHKAAGIVQQALPQIAEAAKLFASTLKSGGRVFYIGAGTSGRLGVLDAAECPPTFGTDPSQIVGVISGGHETLVLSREGVEDRRDAAVDDLKTHELGGHDLLIGIAASIRTPYTQAGLEYARSLGARTVFVVCNDAAELAPEVDILITLPVGPEAITGSTRMKAGTAQKMTLNLISTTAMVLLGKTYGNLMVDLKATSEKLAARSRRILTGLLQIDTETAGHLLERAGGSVKTAIVMHRHNCDTAAAERLLSAAGGFISRIPSRDT